MGIISDKMQGQPQAGIPQGQQAPDDDEVPGGPDWNQEPTPEEQDAYERIEVASTTILHEKATQGPIIEQLKAGVDDPAQILAQVAMMVYAQIDEKITGSGGSIPEDVKMSSLFQILDNTAELAEITKTFPVDDQVRDQAIQQLLIVAADAGMISEADLPQIQEMMGQGQGEAQPMGGAQQIAGGA